jgi:hypothetical protein
VFPTRLPGRRPGKCVVSSRYLPRHELAIGPENAGGTADLQQQ